ncbi:MAG TPA: efflux RND transporter periplasmic adaptor subunit [Rhodospirillaceae bacterium]|nr:efflux RND transporter periplasmic adaptor subunit [Rhodospirillaceae bacterium]
MSAAGKGLAAAGIALALGAGYWLGATGRPPPPPPPAVQTAAPARTVIYYKDPGGKAEFSPDPKKDGQGRDFLPVYADEEPQAMPAAVAEPPKGKGRILYYRNPMGLADTSPVPKKDSMGMDYVPVFEGDDDGGPSVRVSIDKVQKLGVRTEAAQLRLLTRTVRAVGTMQVDERLQVVVAPKFEGYVERLRVSATGDAVRKGDILMDIYSPDLVLAQEEYLAAKKALDALPADAGGDAREAARDLVTGALSRLRNWDIPQGDLDRLKRSGVASRTLALASPATGTVLEKTVLQGQRIMPGEPLYRIADLSSLWLIADVSEQDLAVIRLGQTARATFNALPETTFTGKVTFIYPTLSAETRTAKVRIELPNPEGKLKPAFYGTVDIATTGDAHEVVAIPDSALLDSGTRKVVLVERGEGRYEPREVKTGMRADGWIAVLEGLSAGERVVVSANFLIDAESNLRAALQSFQPH